MFEDVVEALDKNIFDRIINVAQWHAVIVLKYDRILMRLGGHLSEGIKLYLCCLKQGRIPMIIVTIHSAEYMLRFRIRLFDLCESHICFDRLSCAPAC